MDDSSRRSELEGLVPALVDRLPAILTEVRELMADEWPDYAEFLRHEQDDVVQAAKAFMEVLIEIAESDVGAFPRGPEPGPQVELFEEIGRIQWREGRDLTTLLSAYQLGARVAWHHVSRAALDTGVAPANLAALAEAVFIFIDRLSSASARGFVMEQSEAVASRERLRDELVDLLLSDRSDSAAVKQAANRAGWTLPREAAVILVAPDNAMGQSVLSRLDSSCLLIRRRGMLGAVVPDPVRPGRRQRLADLLRGAGAVVGHPVPLEYLPASVQIAEVAAALQRSGVLSEDPVFAAEHLDAIIVHRDPRLLAALRRTVLAPLDDLSPAVRERLTETLASWLRHFGDRQAIAAELHVHPQTVRYRMGQLHDLYGTALDDPTSRARLSLALAWSRTREATTDAARGRGERRRTPPVHALTPTDSEVLTESAALTDSGALTDSAALPGGDITDAG
ncbi:MAG TPA: helix-turn-helix domain-containing protein [Micromonosporaceae bacterium]|nr:helix-turn-helix domain-containing protein [Micromonosporaceae bacterium]